MKTDHQIILAGAGGIAEAATLIMTEWNLVNPTVYFGNRTLKNADNLIPSIKEGSLQGCHFEAFHLTDQDPPSNQNILEKLELLLDCFPSSPSY